MVETILKSPSEAMIEEKEAERQALLIFIENINKKDDTKADNNLSIKEREPKQYKRSDIKKYRAIHHYNLAHYTEIQAIREENNGNMPLSEGQIQKLVNDYLELCDILNYPLTLSGICLYLGVDQGGKQAEALNDMILPLLEVKLNGQANNSNLQFIFKHRYKRNDKLELTTSSNQAQAQSVVAQIIQENEQNKGGKALEIIQANQT
jgi:hypothetical protein